MNHIIEKIVSLFGVKRKVAENNLHGYLISDHIYNTTSRKSWKRM